MAQKKQRRRPGSPPEYDNPRPWLKPYDPILRELVSICVFTGKGAEGFEVQLTCVPGLGEEIMQGAESYRVTRVQHQPVDDYGRTNTGWHASVDVELMPPDEPLPKVPRKRQTRPARKPRRVRGTSSRRSG